MSRYPRTVLGTVCLPWADEDSLDEALFCRTITNLVRAGLPDLYVFGTAGEGYAVTDSMFQGVATVFAETMAEAGGAPPMVGLVSLSLGTMIERAEFCLARGITTFQFSLPSWAPVSDVELRRVFAELCGRFPEAKFLHYNLMRSGRLVRPVEYAELAERHPNLVATKYGGGDPFMISGLMRCRSTAAAGPIVRPQAMPASAASTTLTQPRRVAGHRRLNPVPPQAREPGTAERMSPTPGWSRLIKEQTSGRHPTGQV